jgi:hypothetical protein
LAGTLGSLQAITGQLYLAITVALLVVAPLVVLSRAEGRRPDSASRD